MRAHGSLLLHLRRLRQWEHLQGIPDWPAAKNPGDVDTVDHLVASLYDVVSGPAGQRDWDRFRALFVPDGRLAWIVPESAAKGCTGTQG
jgi:hypothetical protein